MLNGLFVLGRESCSPLYHTGNHDVVDNAEFIREDEKKDERERNNENYMDNQENSMDDIDHNFLLDSFYPLIEESNSINEDNEFLSNNFNSYIGLHSKLSSLFLLSKENLGEIDVIKLDEDISRIIKEMMEINPRGNFFFLSFLLNFTFHDF